MSLSRFVGSVFLPYAAAYFLSYVFRTINAGIAADLFAEFHLSSANWELLSAVYFLVFAIMQIPLAILLDRVEPGLVQSVLMLFASVGALIFAEAQSFTWLVIGRGLIGLGVAATLAAGLKTFVIWIPFGRIPLTAGIMVMFGSFGTLAATGPADAITQYLGWRGLFVILAALTALVALAVMLAAPEATARAAPQQAGPKMSAIYRDRRFWRIVPLCALGVGNSWSLQSLWAAPWMRDVQGLDQTSIVYHLGVMAFAVCIGAPIFGLLSVRHHRFGIKAEHLLVATLSLSTLAQIALVLRLPLPPALIWIMISLAGATTVLGYVLINDYFPGSLSARASGALNLLNIGATLVLQGATSLIFAQWPNRDGTYPLAAYQTGLAIPLIPQVIALAWFLAPRRRLLPSMRETVTGPLRAEYLLHYSPTRSAPSGALPLRDAKRPRFENTRGWPFAALASTVLCIALATAVVSSPGFSSPGVAYWSSVHSGVAAKSTLPSWTVRQIMGKPEVMVIEGLRR